MKEREFLGELANAKDFPTVSRRHAKRTISESEFENTSDLDVACTASSKVSKLPLCVYLTREISLKP